MALAADGRATTAPESDGSPSDTFVVRPSRRKVHVDMAVSALCFVGLGVLILTTDRHDRSLVLDVIVFVYAPAAFGLQARRWRRLLATGSLLEIGPAGVRLNHLGHGWLVLPWAAVGSIGPDSMFRTVVVQPAVGVDRSTPGTQWPDGRLVDLRPRRWGFRVPLRFTDAKMHQVVVAVRHFRPQP
jgi:hypothetical protein